MQRMVADVAAFVRGFFDQVSKAFPKLKTLSMMNNPAAPSYFNGGSVEENREYRCVGE